MRKYIGIFDSGVGGLTVMRQIARDLPHESLIYYGDTARVPYGEKSRETIIRYSIDNAIFLMEKDIKLLVVACNTASAYAIDKLTQIFNIPILGVIEPGVAKVVEVSKKGNMAILGTKGTIQSEVYQKAIASRLPKATLFPIACPLFVPLVEEHFIDHPATKLIVKEYLTPLKKKEIDTLLLGCTHYPFLKDLIQAEMGEEVVIVDSATTCAAAVAQMLQQYNLQSTDFSSPPTYHYYVSDDPVRFQKTGERFLGIPLDHVRKTNYRPEDTYN